MEISYKITDRGVKTFAFSGTLTQDEQIEAHRGLFGLSQCVITRRSNYGAMLYDATRVFGHHILFFVDDSAVYAFDDSGGYLVAGDGINSHQVLAILFARYEKGFFENYV